MRLIKSTPLGLILLFGMELFFFSFFLFTCRKLGIDSGLLFEEIIISAIGAGLTSVLFSLLLKNSFSLWKISVDKSHEVILVITFALVLFLGASSTILNIDRSRSFFVLSWVNQGLVSNKNGQVDLQKVHSMEKLNPEGISQRLSEQMARGLVKVNQNNYVLTNKGKFTLSISDALARIFTLDGWNKNRN